MRPAHARIVPCSPPGSTRTAARRCSGSRRCPIPSRARARCSSGSGRVPQPPRRLGAEGAALGAEAAHPRCRRRGRRRGARRGRRRPRVGDRVVLNPGIEHGDMITVIGEHCDGTHAELIAVDDAQVFPLDDALSFEVAAAFPLVYETAYRMLVTRRRAGRRVGADLGDRRRRRHGGVRDLPRRSAPDDRHVGRTTTSWRGRSNGAPTSASTTRRPTSWRRCARRRERGSTSSSRRSGRRPGRGRSPRSAPRVGSSSAARRAAPTRPRSSTGSGGSS